MVSDNITMYNALCCNFSTKLRKYQLKNQQKSSDFCSSLSKRFYSDDAKLNSTNDHFIILRGIPFEMTEQHVVDFLKGLTYTIQTLRSRLKFFVLSINFFQYF